MLRYPVPPGQVTLLWFYPGSVLTTSDFGCYCFPLRQRETSQKTLFITSNLKIEHSLNVQRRQRQSNRRNIESELYNEENSLSSSTFFADRPWSDFTFPSLYSSSYSIVSTPHALWISRFRYFSSKLWNTELWMPSASFAAASMTLSHDCRSASRPYKLYNIVQQVTSFWYILHVHTVQVYTRTLSPNL